MSEGKLMREVQIALCKDPLVRLLRNNVGEAWAGAWYRDSQGRVVIPNAYRIRYGLGVGTSDLIGIKSELVTLEMVGLRLARFVAIETKGTLTRTRTEQKAFIEVVNTLGGRAGIARSVADARGVLTGS